jgi:hypothetical protein
LYTQQCYPYYCYKDYPSPRLHFHDFSYKKTKRSFTVCQFLQVGSKVFKIALSRKLTRRKEKHGIYCHNVAHLGSFNKVNVKALQCQPCTEYGAQMKSTHDVWSLQPLTPRRITAPIKLIVLVSRSSNGARIKKEIYRYIWEFIFSYKQ